MKTMTWCKIKFLTNEPPLAFFHVAVFFQHKLLILGGINLKGYMPIDFQSIEMS